MAGSEGRPEVKAVFRNSFIQPGMKIPAGMRMPVRKVNHKPRLLIPTGSYHDPRVVCPRCGRNHVVRLGVRFYSKDRYRSDRATVRYYCLKCLRVFVFPRKDKFHEWITPEISEFIYSMKGEGYSYRQIARKIRAAYNVELHPTSLSQHVRANGTKGRN